MQRGSDASCCVFVAFRPTPFPTLQEAFKYTEGASGNSHGTRERGVFYAQGVEQKIREVCRAAGER